MATLETVLIQASRLSILDKVRLIERVTPKIKQELRASQVQPAKPYRSLWGICRDLGPAPSDEDINQARQEFLADFPRDDVG